MYIGERNRINVAIQDAAKEMEEAKRKGESVSASELAAKYNIPGYEGNISEQARPPKEFASTEQPIYINGVPYQKGSPEAKKYLEEQSKILPGDILIKNDSGDVGVYRGKEKLGTTTTETFNAVAATQKTNIIPTTEERIAYVLQKQGKTTATNSGALQWYEPSKDRYYTYKDNVLFGETKSRTAKFNVPLTYAMERQRDEARRKSFLDPFNVQSFLPMSYEGQPRSFVGSAFSEASKVPLLGRLVKPIESVTSQYEPQIFSTEQKYREGARKSLGLITYPLRQGDTMIGSTLSNVKLGGGLNLQNIFSESSKRLEAKGTGVGYVGSGVLNTANILYENPAESYATLQVIPSKAILGAYGVSSIFNVASEKTPAGKAKKSLIVVGELAGFKGLEYGMKGTGELFGKLKSKLEPVKIKEMSLEQAFLNKEQKIYRGRFASDVVYKIQSGQNPSVSYKVQVRPEKPMRSNIVQRGRIAIKTAKLTIKSEKGKTIEGVIGSRSTMTASDRGGAVTNVVVKIGKKYYAAQTGGLFEVTTGAKPGTFYTTGQVKTIRSKFLKELPTNKFYSHELRGKEVPTETMKRVGKGNVIPFLQTGKQTYYRTPFKLFKKQGTKVFSQEFLTSRYSPEDYAFLLKNKGILDYNPSGTPKQMRGNLGLYYGWGSGSKGKILIDKRVTETTYGIADILGIKYKIKYPRSKVVAHELVHSQTPRWIYKIDWYYPNPGEMANGGFFTRLRYKGSASEIVANSLQAYYAQRGFPVTKPIWKEQRPTIVSKGKGIPKKFYDIERIFKKSKAKPVFTQGLTKMETQDNIVKLTTTSTGKTSEKIRVRLQGNQPNIKEVTRKLLLSKKAELGKPEIEGVQNVGRGTKQTLKDAIINENLTVKEASKGIAEKTYRKTYLEPKYRESYRESFGNVGKELIKANAFSNIEIVDILPKRKSVYDRGFDLDIFPRERQKLRQLPRANIDYVFRIDTTPKSVLLPLTRNKLRIKAEQAQRVAQITEQKQKLTNRWGEGVPDIIIPPDIPPPDLPFVLPDNRLNKKKKSLLDLKPSTSKPIYTSDIYSQVFDIYTKKPKSKSFTGLEIRGIVRGK